MYEKPVTKLTDEQIEHALDDALVRDDASFVAELMGEHLRRGHEVEV